MEEEKNVLFSQDDLINEEPQNNLENGYTEELDFLQPAVEQATQTPVAPEPVYEEASVTPEPVVQETPVAPQPTPVYEAAPVETYDDEIGDVKPVVSKPVKQEINENPMGKIKLNKQEEVKQEEIDPASIKLDFKGNKNLKFVIALGILLLLAVILIPMFVTKMI